MTLKDVLPRLNSPKPDGRGGYFAFCPCHDDGAKQGRRSLHVQERNGRLLLYCFAGCRYEDIVAALGLGGKTASGHQEPEAVYEYLDQDGRLLFEVLRFRGKRFSQRQPCPKGGACGATNERGKIICKPAPDGTWWHWSTKDVRLVPYRLPQVMQAVDRGEVVFVAEGEKDCDNLAALGLVATTNPRGAGKWPKDFAGYFRDAQVVILPDNDEPGRKHAEAVARALARVAAEVKVVELPGLPDKGDVSDWLAAGGTKEKLLALAAEAPRWEPRKAARIANGTVSSTGLGFTDLENAQRLVARHSRDLRYCWPWRKWLIWDGRRWKLDDTGEVMRRAKETVRAMLAEAAGLEDDKAREAALEAAMKCQSRHKLEAMITLAASEPGVPVTPGELDRDGWLLNVLNGTLDLRTGELRPHQREDLATKLVPVEYDSQAACPLWEAFLDRIMAGNQELIRYLQKAAGYSLTGDVSEQVFFVLHGSGANGKSVFLNTLLGVLGDYGTQAPPDLLMAKQGERHPTELADLKGARLVVAIESNEGRRLAENLVKQLTGGDRIKARRMREDFWEFEATHKLWLATNHKPIIRGSDYAIWRRIRLIPFSVTIPPEEQDKQLPAKLRRELPGILRWAVEGCLAWQREGLGEPPEVVEATADYRAEMDVLANFLGECCVVNPLAKVPVAALYKAYAQWCEENGEWTLSQRELGTRLKERGFRQAKKAKGQRCWIGIGLRTEDEVAKVAQGGANFGINAYIGGRDGLYGKQRHPTPLTPPSNDSPTAPCPVCGDSSWWQTKDGRWVCNTCHPCPDPSLAVEVVNGA